MPAPDGRHAKQPYRVRVGSVWYWVDPTISTDAIEPGDALIIYPVSGDVTLATLRSPSVGNDTDRSMHFTNLEGQRFTMPRSDIAALHLAAVDDDQT